MTIPAKTPAVWIFVSLLLYFGAALLLEIPPAFIVEGDRNSPLTWWSWTIFQGAEAMYHLSYAIGLFYAPWILESINIKPDTPNNMVLTMSAFILPSIHLLATLQHLGTIVLRIFGYEGELAIGMGWLDGLLVFISCCVAAFLTWRQWRKKRFFGTNEPIM